VIPCMTAFSRERAFPEAVFGPVLRLAFARFASSCLCETIVHHAERCDAFAISLQTNVIKSCRLSFQVRAGTRPVLVVCRWGPVAFLKRISPGCRVPGQVFASVDIGWLPAGLPRLKVSSRSFSRLTA
jgi:hypothetical protein